MDDLVRYGPWLACAVALLLAGIALRVATRARSQPVAPLAPELSSAPPTPPPPDPAVRILEERRSLEERLGSLERRMDALSAGVADLSRPEPEVVAPMRPPVPTTVEPLAAPRSGWRMFP